MADSCFPSHVPILDFGPYLDERIDEKERAAHLESLAAQLRKASEEVGFYFVKGAEGLVPEAQVQEMFEVARKFHDLDEEVKSRYALDPRTQKGYMANYANVEKPQDGLREGDSKTMKLMTASNAYNSAYFASKAVGTGVLGGEKADLSGNPWPEAELPEFHEACVRYDECLTQLRAKLVPVYAKALGMPLDELQEKFRHHELVQYRLTHYPETPKNLDGEMYGIYPHVDTDFLTILAPNKVPGLKIRLVSGEWVPVPQMRNTFLVNTGEILHRLTNGKWLNTFHRADNSSGEERYAVVCFLSLDKNAVIEPIIEPGQEPKYGTRFTAKDVYRDIMQNPKGLAATDGEYLGSKL